jgi:hypothetical protein
MVERQNEQRLVESYGFHAQPFLIAKPEAR